MKPIQPLCSEESVLEAREAQRRERQMVYELTGIRIEDDGRVTKAETDVLKPRQSPDLTTN